MRTSIDIDGPLLRQAMRLSGNPTKKATVEAGLRLLIEVNAQMSIRQLRGKVRWREVAGGNKWTRALPNSRRLPPRKPSAK